MPVYVVPEDEQLLYMYEEVKQAATMHASSIFFRGERDREKRAKPSQHARVTRFSCLCFSPSKYGHSYSFPDLGEQQRSDKSHHRQRRGYSGGETSDAQTRGIAYLNDALRLGK